MLYSDHHGNTIPDTGVASCGFVIVYIAGSIGFGTRHSPQFPFSAPALESHAEEDEAAKALALWLNSTLGFIMFLGYREETHGAFVQFKKPLLSRQENFFGKSIEPIS